MKTLAVALMLIATMLLPVVSMAAPKHAASASKHVPAADAAKSAEDADAPAPEVEDKSLKGQIRATVVAGGWRRAGDAIAHRPGLARHFRGGAGVARVAGAADFPVTLDRATSPRAGGVCRRLPQHHCAGQGVARRTQCRPVAPRAAQQIARQAAKSKAANAPATSTCPNSCVAPTLISCASSGLGSRRLERYRRICQEGNLRRTQDAVEATRRQTESHRRRSARCRIAELESGEGIYVASVKFSGMIREENNAAKRFVEVWSMSKPISSAGGWTLAGIQQFE